LPAHLRRGTLGPKHLAKRILYRYVPRELLDRPKQGVGIPLAAWLRDGRRELVRDYLSPARIRAAGIMDTELVDAVVSGFYDGDEGLARPLWLLLTFEMWREHWASSSPLPARRGEQRPEKRFVPVEHPLHVVVRSHVAFRDLAEPAPLRRVCEQLPDRRDHLVERADDAADRTAVDARAAVDERDGRLAQAPRLQEGIREALAFRRVHEQRGPFEIGVHLRIRHETFELQVRQARRALPDLVVQPALQDVAPAHHSEPVFRQGLGEVEEKVGTLDVPDRGNPQHALLRQRARRRRRLVAVRDQHGFATGFLPYFLLLQRVLHDDAVDVAQAVAEHPAVAAEADLRRAGHGEDRLAPVAPAVVRQHARDHSGAALVHDVGLHALQRAPQAREPRRQESQHRNPRVRPEGL